MIYSLKVTEVLNEGLYSQVNVSPSVDWKGEKFRMISVEPLVTNTLDEAFVLDMVTEPLFQTAAVVLQERASGSPTYCCLEAADAHAKPIMVVVRDACAP